MPTVPYRRCAAQYHMAFFDKDWTHLEAMDRHNQTAHDMFELLTAWNIVHQRAARSSDVVLTGWEIATFVTIEVQYVEK